MLVRTTSSGPASSSSNVPVSGTMYQQSALNKSNEQSTTYLEKKSGELTENLSIIQTQIKSAIDQLEIVRNQYEQALSKANRRRAGKLCIRCQARCSNPTCGDPKTMTPPLRTTTKNSRKKRYRKYKQK